MVLPDVIQLNEGDAIHHRPSVVFLDHVGSESKKDRSRVNWNEAHIVCSLVEDLLLRNPVSTLAPDSHGTYTDRSTQSICEVPI